MNPLPHPPLRWPQRFLIGLTVLTWGLVTWFCLLSIDSAIERSFVVTVWVATALTVGFWSRRAWFGMLAASAFYGLMWSASALKFQYLEVPAIAPDLYYFFSLDTVKVIAGYPLLAVACLALLGGIPLLLWLAWRSEPSADWSRHPAPRRRWGRRAGVGFGLLILAMSLTPQGVFGTVYGKPMWLAVNDQSFIADFIISFYDTQIQIPPASVAADPAIDWTAASAPDSAAGAVAAADPAPSPDIVAVLEESTFDPNQIVVCRKQPLCQRAMFKPDARTLAHGLLGVHSFGGGTWTAEFSLITGLVHTLFGNAGLYAPYNLAPRVQFSVAKSLRAQGYRVVGLYPTGADFLNGRNAYRNYGFDQLYDGIELGLPHLARDQQVFALFWKLYQQEKQAHPDQPLFFFVLTLHQHGPHMTALRKLPAPYNRALFLHRLGKKKDLDDWLNLNLANYLQRNAESDVAMGDLEKRLLDRKQPTLLLHFGDHQPSFDGAMMVLDKALPADWGEHPQWATYYLLKSNIANAPRFHYPTLNLAYLGGLLMQAAGIPPNAYYTANRRLRERCDGRYEECADPRWLPSYHDYIFRQLKVLGEE